MLLIGIDDHLSSTLVSVVPFGCRMRNKLKQVTGCVGTAVEGHQQ